ncbi:TIGR04222 domain-containing membrane protein [Streptomyces sp. NPDC093225]|uniref:TIGR04222 domain-containing membrane protein n=1 Tax=Streptomyces sp. NPDC093225 TaxID=3366034 RepID=UPI0037FFC49F
MNYFALIVWVGVVASTLGLAVGVYRSRRAGGAGATVHDLTEAAFLAGGPRRVVDTALVALCQDGRMMIGGPGIVQVRSGARAADPVERAVLAAHEAAPSGALQWLRLAVMRDAAVQETGDGLAARGLLSAPGAGAALRRWGLIQAVVCLLLVPSAFVLTVVQWAAATDEYDFDVPLFLLAVPALFLGLIAGLVLRAVAGRRVTAAGKAALAAYRATHLASADLSVLTALQGPRALPDPLLRSQLLMLVPGAAGRPRGHAGSSSSRAHRSHGTHDSDSAFATPVMWCASPDTGSGGGGGDWSGCGSSGSSCGSSGSSCGSSGSSCGSSGSSCGSSGSSCGSSSSSCSSSSSSCGSSSSSSCGSSSS